jgi:hypothetical protein
MAARAPIPLLQTQVMIPLIVLAQVAAQIVLTGVVRWRRRLAASLRPYNDCWKDDARYSPHLVKRFDIAASSSAIIFFPS